jgi:transposase
MAAVKLHRLLDLRRAIPAFINIGDGKVHDVNVLGILCVEARAFYVMDRGYLHFKRHNSLHQRQAFFVIRARANMRARRMYAAIDQTIAITGFKTSRDYPEHLRRIRLKSRWQVELFFKWIKQHLRIMKLLGTTENAVKTQIWCAVSTYLLIAIIKKELQLKTSLYTLVQIFFGIGIRENPTAMRLTGRRHTGNFSRRL